MSRSITEEPLGQGTLLELARFPGTDRFQVIRLLGQGGHGAVYEAFDRFRQARVALKTLRRENPEALYRFKQEFRALTDVAHPNLISLYELVSDGNLWFFTMELIEGGNLLDDVWERLEVPRMQGGHPRGAEADLGGRTWTPRGPKWGLGAPSLAGPFRLKKERLRPALSQLARGVLALHSAGKLHCDIKPSNVLVDGEGRVVLVDFGLVTDLHAAPGGGGWAGGTPGYMPPEQLQGLQLMPASDWYSVGALLHEVLTGRTPAHGPEQGALTSSDDPELVTWGMLCRELLRERPEDRLSGEEFLRQLEVAPTGKLHRAWTAPATRREDALVGRAPHMARLRVALQTVVAGRSAALRVVGPSGVGKSALVRSFLEEAKRRVAGLQVLTGRCYEREAVPYNALDSLVDDLCRYLLTLPAGEVSEWWGTEAGELTRLFPVLRQFERRRELGASTREAPHTQERRRRSFSAFRHLLTRLAARHPTVLFIDDVQWGDIDSARMLSEVLRPPEPPPLLLIFSHRHNSVSSPFLEVFLPEWARFSAEVETDELHVEELSLSESEELAATLVGSGSSAAYGEIPTMARESAGNPFFLQELVRHALSSGAPEGLTTVSLGELLQRRVLQLSLDARRLLETVTIAGRPVPETVVTEASGIQGPTGSALAELRAARLVNIRSGSDDALIEPYHDKVREAIVSQMPVEQRRAQHIRLALALEKSSERDLPSLVEHFQEAGETAWAGEYVVPAARQAEKALAFERAASLYRLALELRPAGVDSLALRTSLAEAFAHAGRSGEAGVEFLASARELQARSPDDERVLELEQCAADHFLRSGRTAEGLSVLRHVLASTGLPYAQTVGASLLSLLKNRAHLFWRGMRFTLHAEAEVPRTSLRKLDACWAAVVGHALVDPLRSGAYQALGTLMALDIGEPRRLVRVLSAEASYLASVGKRARREQSQRIVAMATDIAQELNDPSCRAYAHSGAGVRAFFCGYWREAFEQCERATRIFREERAGSTWEIILNAGVAHYALAYLGRFEELAHRSPRLLREIDVKGDVFGSTTLRVGMHNQVWLALDRPDEAERLAEEGMARWPSGTYHQQHSMHLIGLQELDLYRDRPWDAWQRLQEHWPKLRRALFLSRQFVRVELHFLRARCALAAATHARLTGGGGGNERWTHRRMVAAAAASAAVLEREDFSCAPAYAAVVRAGLAAAAGRGEVAAGKLEWAATRFAELGMAAFASAALIQRGAAMQGTTAHKSRDSGERQMRALGVVDPARMARLLVPGFPA